MKGLLGGVVAGGAAAVGVKGKSKGEGEVLRVVSVEGDTAFTVERGVEHGACSTECSEFLVMDFKRRR